MHAKRTGGWRPGLALAAVIAMAAQPGPAAPAATNDAPDEALRELELFSEALVYIRKYYVQEKSYRQIVRGAMHGMLEALDPHSSFLEPEGFQDLQEATDGSFGGIGVQIGVRDGMLTIVAPIEDSPAYKAGLQAGDRIVAIDGAKTQELSLSECIQKMRGAKGAAVVLTVVPERSETARDVTVVRDDVKVPSVKGARLLDDGIGYIRIVSFDENAGAELQAGLDKLRAQGLRALVLDLRNNPGGLLHAAVDVAQRFLKKGALVVIRKGREGVHPTVRNSAEGEQHDVALPLVVLVNGGSASAAEIVAGALQDHKRAVLVGTTTFGKASVQSVIRLSANGGTSDCGLRLTTAHYYTPLGREIHDTGIDPDIYIELAPEEWRDVQLQRAHIENPGAFDEREKARLAGVVDRQLMRAVDLLSAMLALEARR